MKKSLILLCALLFSAAAAANAGLMRPGKWQVTVQMESPNGSVRLPAVTQVVCITAEQAAKPEPPKANTNADCTLANYTIAGNLVTWTIACPKSNMTGSGRMTFTIDTYEGAVTMRVDDLEMTQKFSGRYLGACDW